MTDLKDKDSDKEIEEVELEEKKSEVEIIEIKNINNGEEEEEKKLEKAEEEENDRKKASERRKAALQCHNKLQDMWGKKKTQNLSMVFNKVEKCEVEAWAIDHALRYYWDKLEKHDEDCYISVSPKDCSKLRAIVADILDEYLEQFSFVQTYEIPDPKIAKEREEKNRLKRLAEQEKQKESELTLEDDTESIDNDPEVFTPKRHLSRSNSIKVDDPQVTTKPSLTRRSTFAKLLRIDSKRTVGSSPLSKSTDNLMLDGVKLRENAKKRKNFKTRSVSDVIFNKFPANNNNNNNGNHELQHADSDSKVDKGKNKKDSDKSFNPINRIKNFGSKISKRKSKIFNGSDFKSNKLSNSHPGDDRFARNNNNLVSSSCNTTSNLSAIKKSKQIIEKARSSEDTIPFIEEEPIPLIKIVKTYFRTDEISEIIRTRIGDVFPTPAPSDENNTFEFYHHSFQGSRASNEDEYSVVEYVNELLDIKDSSRYSFLAVYDGHSGKYASLYSRSQVHFNVCSHPEFESNVDKAIHDSFIRTDEKLNDYQTLEKFNCGTTALSVWIKDQKEVIVGNVGDCRGFINRGGVPIEIADPHSPCKEEEKARIIAAGGAVVRIGTWRVNGVLSVSRSLGDNNLKDLVIATPDVTKFTLEEEDEYMLIASDGLWDVFKYDEVIAYISANLESKGKKRISKALCEEAVLRKSQDNVTVVVVFFKKNI